MASGLRAQSSFLSLCTIVGSGRGTGLPLRGGLMAQKDLFLWCQNWKRNFFPEGISGNDL